MNEDFESEEGKVKDTPVYSQMSIEYISGQIKEAKKKGIIQGLLIALAIVLISGLLIAGV